MWRRECEEIVWEAGIFVVAVCDSALLSASQPLSIRRARLYPAMSSFSFIKRASSRRVSAPHAFIYTRGNARRFLCRRQEMYGSSFGAANKSTQSLAETVTVPCRIRGLAHERQHPFLSVDSILRILLIASILRPQGLGHGIRMNGDRLTRRKS